MDYRKPCAWRKCKEMAELAINSFDPYLMSKDNLSEVIPYCEKHLEMIRNGKFEKPYKAHQEFYYLITKHHNKPFYSTNDEDIKNLERLKAMFKLYDF